MAQSGIIEYSEPILSRQIGHFAIKYRTHPLPKGSSSCWYQLFANPVIVPGFPLAPRSHKEQGLEASIGLMAALIGARHAVAFEGGFVIKGFSAMLVPIQNNGDSIQWHMISNGTENRMAYQEASLRCPNRCSLEEVDEKVLLSTRAFLGWWKKAESYLGSESINYDQLDWSSAKETSRSVRISGGSLGFQNYVAGQVNFVLGPKDGRLHLSQKGPFEARMRSAEKHPVVLYDNDDRRGWLVPAAEVIVHIMFGRNHLRPYNCEGKPIHLEPTNPSSSNPTRLALLQNQHIQLFDDVQYTYGDAVLDLWSNIEVLIDKTHALNSASGIPVRNPFRNKLRGWEIMSLVEETPVLRRKQCPIDNNGGWVNMVKDLDAVILFGRGLGEIIRPVQTKQLCQQWRCLPKGNDFLAVGCQLLQEMINQAGSRNDHKYLTSTGLRFSKRSELFTPCKHEGGPLCDCLRLQKVEQCSFLSTLHDDKDQFFYLPEQGCVIFGDSWRLSRKSHKNKMWYKTSIKNDLRPSLLEGGKEILEVKRNTPSTKFDADPKDLCLSQQSANLSDCETIPQEPKTCSTPKRKQVVAESEPLPMTTFKPKNNKEHQNFSRAGRCGKGMSSQDIEDDEDENQEVPMVKLEVTPTPILRRKGYFERHEASCVCRACRLEKNRHYKVTKPST